MTELNIESWVWVTCTQFWGVLKMRTNLVNSLGPSDAIWWQKTGSTLVQEMACCLTAPNHYLNQYSLSSVRSSDILLRAISQQVPQPSVTVTGLKSTHLKFHQNLTGHNELTQGDLMTCMCQRNGSSLVQVMALPLNDTNPLTKPILTDYQFGVAAFIWGQWHRKCSRYQSPKLLKLTYLKQSDIPRAIELK